LRTARSPKRPPRAIGGAQRPAACFDLRNVPSAAARRERRFDSMKSCSYAVTRMKRKTTVYIEDVLLRAARVTAARTGKRDSQVVEDALRAHLGFELLERVGERSSLSDVEALAMADEERHR
ncbi:MAG: hypothetical protein ACREM2_01920, partial [Vulcanimicrobiaceae bacterium]